MRFSSLLGVVLLSACTAARAPVTSSPQARPAELDADDVFSREGVEGVFVLRDEATDCVQTTDAAMADLGFSPKSTFKIPNALIGLETGASPQVIRNSRRERDPLAPICMR